MILTIILMLTFLENVYRRVLNYCWVICACLHALSYGEGFLESKKERER